MNGVAMKTQNTYKLLYLHFNSGCVDEPQSYIYLLPEVV